VATDLKWKDTTIAAAETMMIESARATTIETKTIAVITVDTNARANVEAVQNTAIATQNIVIGVDLEREGRALLRTIRPVPAAAAANLRPTRRPAADPRRNPKSPPPNPPPPTPRPRAFYPNSHLATKLSKNVKNAVPNAEPPESKLDSGTPRRRTPFEIPIYTRCSPGRKRKK
jgi:hypothetical protein